MRTLRYYTGQFIRNALPNSVARQINQFRRKLETRSQEIAKSKTVARYGYFDSEQLYQALSGIGIQKGGVLLVQCSFGRFYNFQGTAEDVLNVLEELVGPQGTLMMPAHPAYRAGRPLKFDVGKTPTITGIVSELFRRRPNVQRSLHPTHSVCALGPLAETLVADHHKDHLSCGPLSPYAKMVKYYGQILGLGLPPGYTTFLHVVEEIDPQTYPRNLYLKQADEFIIIDEAGQQSKLKLHQRDEKVLATMNLARVVKHLTEQAHQTLSIQGIPAFLAHTKPLLAELQELTARGIIIYA